MLPLNKDHQHYFDPRLGYLGLQDESVAPVERLWEFSHLMYAF